jgi:hypothetical protein
MGDNAAMEKFTVGSATARVVCDSLYNGSRLTSLEVTFPRPFLAEFNTHCRLSRNSASSRAIPAWKRMESVLKDPYVPNSFGVNKAGMSAGEDLSPQDQESVIKNWLFGRDMALAQAYMLAGGRNEIMSSAKGADSTTRAEAICNAVDEIIKSYGLENSLFAQSQGLHKQHANRVLETYSSHTVIVTATHWRNFFGLRASPHAQPEACDFALAMAKAMMASEPKILSIDEWHLPYVSDEDRQEVQDQKTLAMASAGKCARTSYLTHDGVRSIDKDIELAESLLSNGHMSPFQHPARPREDGDPAGSSGNYSGEWTQLRKMLENEHDFSRLVSSEELLIGCRGDEKVAEFIISLTA